ncbi:MAG: hypothetical protein M3Z19_01400 [Chloroflexota bacterium]|nr:hypothetical protein [Chloroflexota bacterium]
MAEKNQRKPAARQADAMEPAGDAPADTEKHGTSPKDDAASRESNIGDATVGERRRGADVPHDERN